MTESIFNNVSLAELRKLESAIESAESKTAKQKAQSAVSAYIKTAQIVVTFANDIKVVFNQQKRARNYLRNAGYRTSLLTKIVTSNGQLQWNHALDFTGKHAKITNNSEVRAYEKSAIQAQAKAKEALESIV